MTIKEIKDIFNIDITDKKRTELHVYLKTLYVEQNKKEKSILQLSKDLKLQSCYFALQFKKIRHL
jgi:hypothetical protein